MAFRILVVEDEPELTVILRDNLEIEGYEVLSADTGERGLELVLKERPDLLLLDVMLPKVSGYDICRRVRTAGVDVPIIMLTARNTELDKIAGLDVGADDYMGKPFQIGELMARIRAQLRRRQVAAKSAAGKDFKIGDVTVNVDHREARRGSEQIHLSEREFELLDYFIKHRGEVLTREQLLADVWGQHEDSLTRTVDNFIAKLRKHIETDVQEPRYIVTVHGIGYRLVV